MPTEPKPHQLYKQVEGTEIEATYEGTFLDSLTATNDWETIVLGIGSGAAVKRTYIDLAGWSKQELTTFTQGVDIQKMRTPLANPALAHYLVWEYDILSTRRIQLAEMSFFPMVPGFLGGPSDLDLKDVIYAQSRTYAENTNIPGTYVTTDNGTYGSGNPTAMDKLHWTRLIVFTANGNVISPPVVTTNLEIYPSNLVVQAVTAKEKDLVWMERLRRSYVLQGEL
jgi:hypothetical protein